MRSSGSTKRAGQSRLDEEGYVEGPPELVAEIAASSASYDLHSKLRSYQRHGVREYVVWRVLDEAVDWFSLEGDTYVPLETDDAGVYRSSVFPGLWLDVRALLADNVQRVLEVLSTGLRSEAHTDFVRQLAELDSLPRRRPPAADTKPRPRQTIGPRERAEADALRPHVGKWVAQRGLTVLVAADKPQEVLAWLRQHDIYADAMFHIPFPEELI